jgi:hypothetical protein
MIAPYHHCRKEIASKISRRKNGTAIIGKYCVLTLRSWETVWRRVQTTSPARPLSPDGRCPYAAGDFFQQLSIMQADLFTDTLNAFCRHSRVLIDGAPTGPLRA